MGAVSVKSWSILIYHGFEVSDTVLELSEYSLDVSFEVFELLILNVHDLELCKNFQKLLVDVLNKSIHQQYGPVVRVRVSASWPEKLELVEDHLDGLFDEVKVTCREKLVDWEILEELVVVPRLFELLGKIRIQLKVKDKLNLVGGLEESLGDIDHGGLELLVDLGQGPFDTVPELDFLDGLSFGWVVVHLSDFSNVSDPLVDNLFKSLNKGGIFEILLEVVWLHLSLGLLAFFEPGNDLRVVNEIDVWHSDVLLALDQVNFELVQVLLDVFETLGGSSFGAFLALLVRIEQRYK